MAQPNVAREPSMEEILASIRRIIESNEPIADNAMSASMTYVEEEIEDAEDLGFAPELAANDPGRPLASQASSAYAPSLAVSNYSATESAQIGDRALSLADVAARVRAASVRQQENVAVRAVNLSSKPASIDRQPEPQAAAPKQVQPISAATSLRPAIEPVAQPEPVREEQPRFTAMQERSRVEQPVMAQEFERAPTEEVQSLPAKIEEAANLLSAEAGAQVAKSFNELAAVFNGLEHRSVEEMAQEMLRPMLHEWLDDNLPTLVERLVREEIERVARGPRR
ncbi:DUF2497 domain-containing protein [Neorhizobium lilium]|uniref:DUF2497 domain-containing protein n=1 Tax=Neorhizobium lilium TaxID=2503024 RepID=A0A444LCX4_9HYPH|nr:DUF2497 domain-containing protein [Neorhizobium lilium]RWX75692.1 DUF2497 domain-containing protein [Neorhizobium lilium]